VTDRITTAYVSNIRTKAPGFSSLLRGDSIPKSDPSCQIHSGTERTRILTRKITNYVEKHKIPIDKDFMYVLSWLEKNLFSLSSFAFEKGNTDYHVLPKSLLDFLEEKRDLYKQTSSNTDFVFNTDPLFSLIDELRVEFRLLESYYVGWMYDTRVVAAVYQSFIIDEHICMNRIKNILQVAFILNLFSDYLFWLNQYESKRLESAKPPLRWDTSKVCAHKIEPFKPNDNSEIRTDMQ
jgi:hypothetical protein